MRSNIILIGPVRTGKSAIGKLLSKRLGLDHISLDDLSWDHYREVGYTDNPASHIWKTGGFVTLIFYWKQFEVHAVERVQADFQNSFINLGVVHSVYANKEHLARVQTALAPYPKVILIMPAPNLDESIEMLNEQTKDPTGSFGQGFNWNEYFVRQSSIYDLAKFTVSTNGKKTEETCDQRIRMIDWHM